MTHREPESSMLQIVPKVDDSDHPALASRQSGDQLNPKSMTQQDWVDAQSKDKTIGEIIHLFKTEKLHCQKAMKLTTMR